MKKYFWFFALKLSILFILIDLIFFSSLNLEIKIISMFLLIYLIVIIINNIFNERDKNEK